MRRSDRPSGRSEFVEADAAKRSRDRRHCALRSLTVETEVVGGIPSLAGHARQSRATPNAAVCKIPHQPVGVKDGVREPARRPAIADHLDAQATCLIRDEVAHRLTRRLHNNEVDLVLFCMARRHILQHRNAASYGRHCREGSKRDVPRAESTVEMGRALYRNVCANGGGGCCQRDPATAPSQGVGRTYRWPETGAIVNHQDVAVAAGCHVAKHVPGTKHGHGGFREVWHWRYSTGCDDDKVSFQIEQPNGGLTIIELDVDFAPANLSFEVVHDRLQLHARPRTSARVDRQTRSPSQSAPNGRTDQRCAPDY